MAEKIKNPFIHSHDDGCEHGHHHHHHDHEPFEPSDPAQKSLADAMRVSFMILKTIMFLMLIAYLCTGIFIVEPQQKVVRLRFGEIVGAGEGKVYEQGWHLGWPYPVEEKIAVPTTEQNIRIYKAFWYETNATDTAGNPRGGPLNPEKDGSLITSDANIVHGRFEVYYEINDVIAFIENVGMPKPSDFSQADKLVESVAEQGIVYATAQISADDFIKSQLSRAKIANRMQEVLDSMDTGIKITKVNIKGNEAPLVVKPAYALVTNAESERGQKISAARQERTSLLNETAGEAHEALFKLVQEYELAQSAGQTDKAEQLAQVIDTAFDELRLPAEYGGTQIGGEAARLISEANTYRTETVERIKSEANSFVQLLSKYREAPKLFISRESEQAREEIFSGDVETLYNNSGQLYLEINTDPEISRKREQERILKLQEESGL